MFLIVFSNFDEPPMKKLLKISQSGWDEIVFFVSYGKILGKVYVFKKNFVTSSEICQKIIGTVVETAYYASKRIIRKISSETLLIYFGLLTETVVFFWINFGHVLQNCFIQIQRNNLKRYVCFFLKRKEFHILFRTLSKMYSAGLTKMQLGFQMNNMMIFRVKFSNNFGMFFLGIT